MIVPPRFKSALLIFCFSSAITSSFTQKIPDLIELTQNEKILISRGEIIVRELESSPQKGQTFEAIGMANAPLETLVHIVMDYDKYPEFMPNVSSVEILDQVGNAAVLGFTLDLPMGKVKKYRLEMSLLEFDSETARIKWISKPWPGLKPEETIKETSGFWLLKSRSPDTTLLLYHVYTDPGPIPFGLEWIVDILSKSSIPETLLKTRERAEKLTLE